MKVQRKLSSSIFDFETKDDIRAAFALAIEQFERTKDRFDSEFRLSGYLADYRRTISWFMHEACRARSNLRYALENDNIPKPNWVSRTWEDYRAVIHGTELIRLLMAHVVNSERLNYAIYSRKDDKDR